VDLAVDTAALVSAAVASAG